MTRKDHEKYLRVLPQMSLTPEMVPDDLRLMLYQKLGLTPPEHENDSKPEAPVVAAEPKKENPTVVTEPKQEESPIVK